MHIYIFINIYRNLDIVNKEGYHDYLFLPFLDDTNGDTSYAGGRYIESSIPEGEAMQIDFNQAFNPYCAYNVNYKCPMVPKENKLNNMGPIKLNLLLKLTLYCLFSSSIILL